MLQPKIMSRCTLFLFGLLVVNASICSAQATRYAPKVERAHPDFVLPSIEDGAAIKLSDYRGKKVLLMHFASW